VNKVSTKIIMRKLNDTEIFVDEVETQLREKLLRGSQTQDIHYSEHKARYKIVTLTYTWCSCCNPTRTLPNQVSYLKVSSMESFILGSTPKIDFRCSAATAHLQWLQRKNNFSEHLWNSIPNSCSSQCPGASIYRLRNRMGDCSVICGCRPDGGQGSSGWTTVRQIFHKISLRNLSCLSAASGRWDTVIRTVSRPLQVISLWSLARLDNRGWASEWLNFNTQFQYMLCARLDHDRQSSGRLKSNQQFP
jgi:hypothetical protein